MTKQEFIEGMKEAYYQIEVFNEYTCNEIERNVSRTARLFYENEFRLEPIGVANAWLSHFLIDNHEEELFELDKYQLRLFLTKWFEIWSIENEYYLDYQMRDYQWKEIELQFHSVGLDNEVCYKATSIHYDEFLENKPCRIKVSYQVPLESEVIEIDGVRYKRIGK